MVAASNKAERVRSQFFIFEKEPYSINYKILENTGELYLNYVIPNNSSLVRVSLEVYLDGTINKSFTLDRGETLREKLTLQAYLNISLTSHSS